MNETKSREYSAKEFKVVSLRECPVPAEMAECATPELAAAYWKAHIATAPHFNPEVEGLYVLLLNTRRKVKGHVMVATGTMDTLLVHPREVFRAAIVASAASIVVMHNHPSGDSAPSEADIKITRELARGGHLLRIEVLDHVVVGHEQHTSLRQLGYLFEQ